MKNVYLLLTIVGTIVPYLFFFDFFAEHGVDLPSFVGGLFANGAAAGFSSDVLISAAVFWVWSYTDARENDVRRWWPVIPATLLVGLSLAFPLYLYMREGA